MRDIFENKTQREIACMSEDDIENFIKLELAEKGIPLKPKMPSEFIKDYITKDEIGYTISKCDIIFKDKDNALKVAKILRDLFSDSYQKKYDWHIGYEFEWLEPLEEPSLQVEQKQFYNQNVIVEKSDLLTRIGNAKKEYDKQKSEFSKIREERSKISDWYWSQRYTAKTFVEKVDNIKSSFQEYLDLANNKEQAIAFFEKAWKARVDEEMWDIISEEIKTENAT